MANEQNLREPWKPGQSGNPKGRPKNRVPEQLVTIFGSKAKAKKFYCLSATEINEWEAAILTLSAEDLKVLAKWSGAPSYPKGLAIAVLSDMKNGKTTTLDKLRERQYGKPTQRMEVTGKDGAELIPARTLTKEEAQELFKDLQENY